MKIPGCNQKAFTLIEVMVSLAIAGIVVGVMYSFQQSQVKTYVTQQTIVDMHQNARAAMKYMATELRMAGCNPTGDADVGITEAATDHITFTMDFTGGGTSQIDFDADGNPDYIVRKADGQVGTQEKISYKLTDGNLVRDDEILATSFDVLNIVYYDEDKNRIAAPVPQNRLSDIYSVRISLLARSGDSVPGFMLRQKDSQKYQNIEGDDLFGPANDYFRRILLSSEIRLRNAGLS